MLISLWSVFHIHVSFIRFAVSNPLCPSLFGPCFQFCWLSLFPYHSEVSPGFIPFVWSPFLHGALALGSMSISLFPGCLVLCALRSEGWVVRTALICGTFAVSLSFTSAAGVAAGGRSGDVRRARQHWRCPRRGRARRDACRRQARAASLPGRHQHIRCVRCGHLREDREPSPPLPAGHRSDETGLGVPLPAREPKEWSS